MESPQLMPESPIDDGLDELFPCKGCGQILEEGKAFELDGKRWHIDCFRCNTCGTLLDSDANLLLLGDGSLICNNCTYSCYVCNNKIEDLAILTGDQAFCAGCFRCRNCKRRIENLRYARTSQGIFCMTCHENVMARRKKKLKAQQQAQEKLKQMSSPQLALDKSLPSLPMEDDVPVSDSFADAPTELSPPPNRMQRPSTSTRPQPSGRSISDYPSSQASNRGYGSDAGFADDVHMKAPKPYNTNRHSRISHTSEVSESFGGSGGSGDALDQFFIPLVLDPNPDGPLPSTTYKRDDRNEERMPLPSRAYTAPQENSLRSHIAFQEKPRQGSQNSAASNDYGRPSIDSKKERGYFEQPKDSSSSSKSPYESKQSKYDTPRQAPPLHTQTAGREDKREDFKLGEVPQNRKTGRTPVTSPDSENPPYNVGYSSFPQEQPVFPPRQDSAKPPNMQIPRKPLESPEYSTSGSTAGVTAMTSDSEYPEIQIKKEASDNTLRPGVTQEQMIHPPRTSSARPGASPRPGNNAANASKRQSIVMGSTAPGNKVSHSNSNSVSSLLTATSPVLQNPLTTPVTQFSMEEDFAKIFGEDSDAAQLFRKTSNAVRHGRSYSDLAGRTSANSSPKWPRPPSLRGSRGSYTFNSEIGWVLNSPVVAAKSDDDEEKASLRKELRRSAQKIAELESRLQSTTSEKALENSIQAKRSTVAVLETQRETVLRELEVLKANKENVSSSQTQADPVRALAKELEDLRNSYTREIEELIARKNQLLEENANLIRLRDQTIQETEQLNSKNAQLADLNNELTRQIQAKFQANKAAMAANASVNGLNINYAGSNVGTEGDASHDANEMDPAVFTAQTQIVNLKGKTGQPKKTQWYKKGGAAIVRGANKGFKTVFASESSSSPNLHHNGENTLIAGPRFDSKPTGKQGSPATGPSTSGGLFGVDLVVRSEFEGGKIPLVVTRCIQEVEMRGMDFQGIYRKTGGASQMRQIQESFERGEDVDLSDSSIDICAVTSVLKQYLRKLPNPLLTFEIYDRFLGAAEAPIEEQRILLLREAFDMLPRIHQEILQLLLFHLSRVTEHQSENLMTSRNLAVVFAPTLCWDKDGTREMQDMHAKNNGIQFCIERCGRIFKLEDAPTIGGTRNGSVASLGSQGGIRVVQESTSGRAELMGSSPPGRM